MVRGGRGVQGFGDGVGILSPNSTFPADEETDYEYDQANRLTTATLPSGVEIEFEYDGIGRRLKKTITDDIGTGSEDIIETTIKYHYIGGQLTTIEIDEETTDDSDPPVDTTTKDETIHIHLGPNSQPISFEWVRYDYDEEETLDDTYWFHYDIHGNVLKVTDDTQTTKITYTYNTLGQLTTETNPDGIPNFFKYRGVTQTLHDPLLDLYFGGGFYRPDLGTSLATVGVASNPTSGATISAKAHAFKAAGQTVIQSSLANVSSKVVMNCSVNSGLTAVDGRKPTGSASDTSIDYFAHNKIQIPALKEKIDSKGCAPDLHKKGVMNDNIPGDTDGDGVVDDPSAYGSDPTPDPGDLEGIVEDDVAWWAREAANIANVERKYRKQLEDEVWNDDDPSDDHKQYLWCIRDENGNIVAYLRKNGTGNMFNVGENGNRNTGNGNTSSSCKNWEKIVGGVGEGTHSVGMWDMNNKLCNGSIGMKMEDGTWLGIFFDACKGDEGGCGQSGQIYDFGSAYTYRGSAEDFGFFGTDGETETGAFVTIWEKMGGNSPTGDWNKYHQRFGLCVKTVDSNGDMKIWINPKPNLLIFLYDSNGLLITVGWDLNKNGIPDHKE